MNAVLRTWLGFIALGAGLVHFALVIGSPLPVALVLLLIGAAEFAWGVVTFVRPTPPFPMLARSAALVPVIGWALLLVVAGADSFGPLTGSTTLLPMLVASLFDLLIAFGLTVLIRRAAAERASTTASVASTDWANDGANGPVPDAAAATAIDALPAHPGRYLVGVIGGALVIAALTMPALAATEAAQYARPHSTGGTPTTFDFGGHDH